MKLKNKRWDLAQDYERNWWKARQSEIDFSFYKYYADELKTSLTNYININNETTILEVGSGAGGIVTFLKDSNNRYAIDPLEDFYSSVTSFKEQRDKNVKYQNAVGEEIPFEDKIFDLVIMDNVLDHCEKPQRVMNEVKRVLKNNGVIYFKQNTYHFWGSTIRFFMEKFLIDKGHPHTFSKSKLLNLINDSNLKVVKTSRSGYLKTWLREIKSSNLIDKIKAILFVSRDKVTYIILSNK